MSLSKKEYLVAAENESGELIYTLKVPCKIIIKEEIVNRLKKEYLPDEEIGGVLWLNPQKEDEDWEFICNEVVFLRNTIEDKPRKDGRTRKNAYLTDPIKRKKANAIIFESGCTPLRFHTHPTRKENLIAEFMKISSTRDTSPQDIKVSETPLIIGMKNYYYQML